MQSHFALEFHDEYHFNSKYIQNGMEFRQR